MGGNNSNYCYAIYCVLIKLRVEWTHSENAERQGESGSG